MSIDPKNKIEVFENPTALATAAAEFIIKLAYDCVATRGRFTLSLSGGSTPELLFKLLAGAEYNKRMPWAQTFVFWGDERYVPADDSRNNSFVARTLLLNRVDIPDKNIFATPVEQQPASAVAAAYQQTLQTFFGEALPQFDLIMLGLGENAHTASLFPHTPVLHEQKAWVSALYIDEVKMERITMTIPLINNAHNILFLVAGKSKALVVKTILTEPYQPDQYPAQLISPIDGNLFWFLDQAAAEGIEGQ